MQAGLPGPAVGASSSAGPGELGHLRRSWLVGVSCCHGDLSATDFKVLWPRAAAAPWLELGLRCWRARPRVPVPPLSRCLCLSAPQRGSLPKLLAPPEKNWGCSGLSLGSFSLLRVKGSRKHAGLVSAHVSPKGPPWSPALFPVSLVSSWRGLSAESLQVGTDPPYLENPPAFCSCHTNWSLQIFKI